MMPQLLGSTGQLQKDYFEGHRMGQHVNVVINEKNTTVQKPSYYTFYVTARCEKNKPENETLYMQDHSKTTQTVPNARHMTTPPTPQ
jgi:hypothetical protein